MISTLYASLAGVAALLIAVVGAWLHGKSTGKSQEKAVNDQEKAQAEIVQAKSEQEAKEKSDEITKKIDTEINSAPAGSSAEWLRENANRDGNGK